MNGLFWTNTIWYVLLAVTSAATLVFIFIKTQNRRFTAAFWLAVLGMTYVLEVFLLLVMDAYTYYPGLTSDAFQDAILGNFFSQFSVSATAVLMCVYGLNGGWRVGFSVVYFMIDVLFVQLGIYEHHWYRSIYTLFGFYIYSWLVKKWHQRLLYKPNRLLNGMTLFLGVFASAGNSIMTSLKLLRIQIFTPALFEDMSKNHTSGALIYGPVLIVIMIGLHSWEAKWFVKASALAVLAAAQYLLTAVGLLYIKTGWWPFITGVDLLGYFGWVVLLNRLLQAKDSPHTPTSKVDQLNRHGLWHSLTANTQKR